MNSFRILQRIVGLVVWALIGGYIYGAWKVWNAILSSTAIFEGIANIILFLILVIIGLALIPLGFLLGLFLLVED